MNVYDFDSEENVDRDKSMILHVPNEGYLLEEYIKDSFGDNFQWKEIDGEVIPRVFINAGRDKAWHIFLHEFESVEAVMYDNQILSKHFSKSEKGESELSAIFDWLYGDTGLLV